MKNRQELINAYCEYNTGCMSQLWDNDFMFAVVWNGTDGSEQSNMPDTYDEAIRQYKNISRRKGVVSVRLQAVNRAYEAWEAAQPKDDDDSMPWVKEQVVDAAVENNEPVPSWITEIFEEQEAAVGMQNVPAEKHETWMRLRQAADYVGVLFQQVQQRSARGQMKLTYDNLGRKLVAKSDCDAWIALREVYFMRKMKREFPPADDVETPTLLDESMFEVPSEWKDEPSDADFLI